MRHQRLRKLGRLVSVSAVLVASVPVAMQAASAAPLICQAVDVGAVERYDPYAIAVVPAVNAVTVNWSNTGL